ncbi:MAG TPA: pyridoxamine 5'-phosphate oxidase [Candidatus Competibacteraceae bacterium]|nr:pyridoxamine 5'-phosphate oxidase [Candidatus Competibacteraceae bacterium]HQA26552.1 pyridoxamine 5'-phosphate oxidase [Candidatus Competibacteraceae bacterium]HQD55096.1 pyridoxamine 5'-phosphate oxidase [Candidatus Competibacteraceae bacterium]
MSKSLAELRHDYALGALCEADVDPDPIKQFQRWLQTAVAARLPEPNAMTLATADRTGRPSARVVLLKECDADGFVFFTNYRSAKGRQLQQNPQAALVFLWLELERQVRVEGVVEQIAAAESAAYFETRPRDSRLGALASHQSQVVANRDIMDQRYQQLAAQYSEGPIPMPEQWGGYRLKPDLLEFWQGRHGRMHDRLRYRAQPDGGWLLQRLEP